MSRVLLDTSALSALFRGHEGVAEALRSAQRIAVNPVVLGELHAGFRGGKQAIAASAMQFGLRLVTTDSDFERVPQIALELHDT